MNIPKQHPHYETKRRNIAIALFLGWFKENGQPDTWYEILGTAQYIAYSEYSDPYKSLPFNRDWNWIMKAVDRVEQQPISCMPYIIKDADELMSVSIQRCDYDRHRHICEVNYDCNSIWHKADTKLEATFIAVSEFCLSWLEKENKLNEIEKYLAVYEN